MGGVIGAVSGKFVLAATGLLFSATVERQKVRAWIDPTAAVSQVSARLAARIDKTGQPSAPNSMLVRRRPMTIGIRAETFGVEALSVTTAPLPNGVDFVVGRDILGAHVFDLNFRSSQIRIILPYEYKDLTRHMTPVALTPGPDGTWSFSVAIVGSPSSTAALQLASPNAVTFNSTPCTGEDRTVPAGPIEIAIGSAELSVGAVTIVASPICTPAITIALKAFARRHIILDLPHHCFWIDQPKPTR